MCWLGRYLVPLVLLVVGAWLCRGAVPAPGMPTVIAGLGLSALTVDGNGALYVGDGIHRGRSRAGVGNHCVWRVGRWGGLRRIAGTGMPGYSGDGGPAAHARLFFPMGLAFDASDRLYIADARNNRVRRVDRRGIISTVAGCGRMSSEGDGGPATRAGLFSPYAIAVDAGGTLFIAERDTSGARMVDPAGLITRLPVPCHPHGMVTDRDGGLVVADYWGHRVLRVGRGAAITEVAGNGREGYRGDGGPATCASLWHPDDVAVDADGNLCVADAANHRVRRIDRQGTITTVVGCGRWRYPGDGGPATEAGLDFPACLAIAGDGALHIVDLNSVRKVDRGGTIRTVVTDETRFGR